MILRAAWCLNEKRKVTISTGDLDLLTRVPLIVLICSYFIDICSVAYCIVLFFCFYLRDLN